MASALFAATLCAQTVELKPVEPVQLPILADSNGASFWRDGKFHIFSSNGIPSLTFGDNQFSLAESITPSLGPGIPDPLWIESVWQDDDGAIFMWYHHEQVGLCGGQSLSVPVIGAAVSYDGGRSLTNLGFVLESGDPVNCEAKNGYFAGGHGDFSVIYNPADSHLYFFFSSYGGDGSGQGVAVARMHIDSRFSPTGAVWKYFGGDWNEPGLGGKVTPIFSAAKPWQDEDTDAFWGPSLHWNTYLNQFVMLMNRSCCAPGWPQEGVYISYNADLSNPGGWKAPEKLIGAGDWYPQVIGSGPGETDRVAGQTTRLYIRGFSDWEMTFHRDDVVESPGPEAGEMKVRR